jgi:hypothetical protein
MKDSHNQIKLVSARDHFEARNKDDREWKKPAFNTLVK